MIKAVVFDMDGLMFDTEALVLKAWQNIGETIGYTVNKSIILKTIGLNEQKTKAIFAQEFGENFNFEYFKKMYETYITKHIEKNGMPIKKGLFDLLTYLKENNYKIGVATSSSKQTAFYYFDKAGVTKYLDQIVGGDMIENGKPAPDIYLKAAELLNVHPSSAIALEDSPYGILAAFRAGMKPIMIPDLIEPNHETQKLLYKKFDSLLDVITLLESHN